MFGVIDAVRQVTSHGEASLGKLMEFCLEGNSLTERITQNGEP